MLYRQTRQKDRHNPPLFPLFPLPGQLIMCKYSGWAERKKVVTVTSIKWANAAFRRGTFRLQAQRLSECRLGVHFDSVTSLCEAVCTLSWHKAPWQQLWPGCLMTGPVGASSHLWSRALGFHATCDLPCSIVANLFSILHFNEFYCLVHCNIDWCLSSLQIQFELIWDSMTQMSHASSSCISCNHGNRTSPQSHDSMIRFLDIKITWVPHPCFTWSWTLKARCSCLCINIK